MIVTVEIQSEPVTFDSIRNPDQSVDGIAKF